jgi:hypothetical protein
LNHLSGYSKPFQDTQILPGLDNDKDFQVGPGDQLLAEILGQKNRPAAGG